MIGTAIYRRSLQLGASAFALCLAAPLALAQSGPAADEPSRDTVVIVGKTLEETLPQELEKYGSDLEIVTSEEIREQAYVDAQQALQMKVPGLYVASRGGPFSYMDISLQGSRTQDMLLTVDGVRINNRLYNTTMSDTLPASMIERIEVLKGGQSLFYGTSSAAGVINFVTRGYTDDFDGVATIGGDTNDSVHADVYARGKAGPGNYVIYASQDKSGGIETYDRTGESTTDLTRSFDVNAYGGKYRWQIADNLSVDARYHHVDARIDNPAPRLINYSKNERDEDIYSVGVNYDPSDWVKLQVKGYWHDWDSNYTTIVNQLNNAGAGPGIAGQIVFDDNTFWGFWDSGINALAEISPGGPFEYIVGYDFQKYSGRDDVLLIRQQEEEVNAPYLQIRSTDDLIKNATFAVGVRYNDAGGSSSTVWNASGVYNFTDALYAEANFGTTFLLPTAEQLYAVDPFSTIGNPNLEPEEAENYNIGFGGDFDMGPAITWEATYFSRDIDNRIQFQDCIDDTADPNYTPAQDCNLLFPGVPLTAHDEGFYANLPGTVEVRGFELQGTVDFENGFSAIASYTDAETKVAGGSQLARVPRSYAKFGGAYDAGQWGAEVNALWVGELRTGSLPGSTDHPNGLTGGTVDFGDYVVVDVAAHMFFDADQHHKVTLRLENALDEEYATGVGSSGPSAGFDTAPRFLFRNRGVPQTLHVSYSYAF